MKNCRLHHIIAMATTCKKFRRKLLTEPKKAILGGDRGETLKITAQDKAVLLSANAKSLEELSTS